MNKKKECKFFVCLLILCVSIFFLSPPSFAQDAKRTGSGVKGYLFEISHAEILARAKKEGSLRALMGVDPASIAAIKDAFSKKYPFLNVYCEEITGTDASARFLMELQAGMVPDWDVIYLEVANYNHLRPYVEKIDLLSMATQKIINIPPAMINPQDRNAVSVGVFADIAAYNSKLLKPSAVPSTHEGFLKPELKGRKFVLDVKPNYLSGLVPLMGLEWTLDFARKLAAQEPIWARGQTRTLASMAAGEYSLQFGTYYHSLIRARKKGMTNLEPVFLEPVSIRLGEAHGVLKGAKHPYAALLLLEFMGGPEGQRIIDETDPGHASVFAPGSMLEQVIAGRKLSVLDWEHFAKRESYDNAIVKAFGFPSVDKSMKKSKK